MRGHLNPPHHVASAPASWIILAVVRSWFPTRIPLSLAPTSAMLRRCRTAPWSDAWWTESKSSFDPHRRPRAPPFVREVV